MRAPGDAATGGEMAQQQRRVLIVDDEETVREVVGQYLELEGYQILQATTGIEALHLAEKTPCWPTSTATATTSQP